MGDRNEFRDSENNLLFFTEIGEGGRLEVRLPNNELLGWCENGETRDHTNKLLSVDENPFQLYSNYLRGEDEELTSNYLEEKGEYFTAEGRKGCLSLSLGVLSLGFVQFVVVIWLTSFTTALILSLIGGFFFFTGGSL